MQNNSIIVELKKPERPFTKVYSDFLYNRGILSCEEKLIFIMLRSFLNYAHDEGGTVYPTMETLAGCAGMSKKRAKRTIDKLIEKGLVKRQRFGRTAPNTYTLSDLPEIWNTGNAEEMKQEAEKTDLQRHIEELEKAGYQVVRPEGQEAEKTDLQRHIEALEAAGYTVVEKEKGLPSSGVEKSPNNNDTYKPSICLSDSNTDSENVQYQNKCSCTSKGSIEEVYTLENLKAYFEYRTIQADEETKAAIFNIIHNVLNTSREKVKVCGELRPAAVVKSRIMKLSGQDIQYVIEKYIEYGRTGRKIKNPEAFILTQLFKAKEQAELETQNDLNVDGY